MTRLALAHDAINLSQGFPNEPPPYDPVFQLICGVLGGDEARAKKLRGATMAALIGNDVRDLTFHDFVRQLTDLGVDELNQYTMPFGRPGLRKKVAEYYKRFYDWEVCPDKNVTIGLGATEPFASALRTLCKPGDSILIFEPFHELYPNQAALFYLQPRYTALRRNSETGEWDVDWQDLERKAEGCKLIILNSPHNPTGKVFSEEELQRICDIAKRNDSIIVTDEIYEFIIFDPTKKHFCVPKFEGMEERTVVINSVSKSLSATGWRIGWAITPTWMTEKFRAVHDQMVLQAPTPQQYGVEAYLSLDDKYFRQDLPRKYLERRNLLYPALKKLGFEVSCPDGAYYLFVKYRSIPKYKAMDPSEFAEYLTKEVGVAGVAGDNFYAESSDGQDYIRFAFCRSIPEIKEAIARLQKDLP